MTSLYAPSADDVIQRLRPFGFFFEKSLKDLIRGIRSHNDTPEQLELFLEGQLSECRQEANSSNMEMKTNAILKLTYLEMYGYDMSWCNFHILEVMSSNKLQQKRVGYLAASQSFHKDADVLMLATNLLKKDLKYGGSNDVFKVGIALSGLSTIVTPELAKDIVDDLFLMLNSSKPYIRKKTVTALYKVFLEYPEALQSNFDNFTSKLEDPDKSVVSATISVVCELSKKNPAPFIKLSPLLYEILIDINDNWIIIRLLKLFTNLSKIEPKLKGRLLPKIVELMDSTNAASVLYESVNCIISGNMLDENDYDVAFQCLEILNRFCNSQDSNLRYISCVLFYKIGKINSNFISQYDELIMKLISDIDISIRLKAIELIEGIVSEDNLKTIVSTLVKQFVGDEVAIIETNRGTSKEIPIVISDNYKIKIVNVILNICGMDNYSNVDNFDWYNAVLYDLAIVSLDLNEDDLGTKIGNQLRNLMIRVPDMRHTTIVNIIKITSLDSVEVRLPTILESCIWSLGEYATYLENGDALIKLFIKKGLHMPHSTQDAVIIAVVKLFSSWCTRNSDQIDYIKDILEQMVDFLTQLNFSKSFEVQEMSIQMSEILKLTLEALEEQSDEIPLLLSDVLPSFFNTYELTPISLGTQKQLPKGIDFDIDLPFLSQEDLDNILDDQETLAEEDMDIYDSDRFSLVSDDKNYGHEASYEDGSSDESETDHFNDTYKDFDEEKYNEERKKETLSNPFYLDEPTGDGNHYKFSDILSTDNEQREKSLNAMEIIKVNDNSHGSQKINDKKKKKKKTKKVKVLADQTIVIPGVTEVDASSKNNKSQSLPNPISSKKISLRMHTKLEDFNFDEQNKNNSDEDQALEHLRSKFEEQDINNDNPNTSNEDEVIVIKKKKKKKKSKSKEDGTSKKKKKERKSKEGSLEATPQL
ncbi:similar to Saccharomyces cerevisiae YPL195W APL5 Delta adaptin-like subunit of the clathrin associated protein complex (AP-3) [Maudiozyma saulgeensis]|uniref:AP-3 complex subunit delta n=1 Tax=Maudiozyma saulgeensis TaxID=1789683 RepID=A0A1X7R759_9SACH|nr:similar to Saccharomyces cerevisiae YPL195W APL5 Delta adaptin-like subunit of the clathrin associated protein complex (AP-3) [Kazachstania saulgeensis]